MTRIRSFVAASLIIVAVFTASGGTALAATHKPSSGLVPWHSSYYDYTIGYPATWRVLTPPDHVAVFLSPGRQSACQVNVSMQVQQGTTAGTLKAVVPPDAVSVSHLTVAGAPAVSFWRYPWSARGLSAQSGAITRTVVVAHRNSAGGVNLYTLQLNIYARAGEHASVSLSNGTCTVSFSAMVASLTLPSSATPAPPPLNSGDGTTAAVQYASKTWNWCDWENGAAHNPPCSQVQQWQPQPDFACAEYVARALSAEGLMPANSSGPGLNPNSAQTGWDSFSDWVYNGTTYYLWNVGSLYQYLTQSGIGQDIGDNPALAAPGDVVFYANQDPSHPGQFELANAQHVTLLTITGGVSGGSDTLVDTHNYAGEDIDYTDFYNGPQLVRTIVHLSINNAADVYALGNSGHLYDYHWTLSNGWAITDLNNAVGLPTSLTGTPSGNTFAQDGNMTQDVYAVGTNGVLYEFWWMSPSWHLTTLNPPAGVSFEGYVTSISFALPGQTTMHHSVFVVGSNGHLYNYAYQEGSWWQLTDLTASLGPTCGRLCGQPFAFVGTPTAHAVILSGVLNQDVYDVGNDGGVYEYWWDGSWHAGSPSAVVMPSDGAGFVNSPSAYSFVLPGSSNNHHNVFALGSDGHLYVYQWCQNCGPWSLTDLSALLGLTGTTFSGSPSLVRFGAPAADVYITGSNGQLYEVYYYNGAWHSGDPSVAAGATNVTVTGSPSAFTNFLYGNPAMRHSVFVVTSDGHLREFLWVQNGGPWQLWDHGAPSGTTLTGSPNAHSYTTF